MSDTHEGLELWLDRGTRRYAPGDALVARFRLGEAATDERCSYEASVLWHTAGLGEEDFSVHHFERGGALRRPAGEDVVFEVATQLPLGPPSYDGAVVKVCWVVRLRLFLPRGRQLVIEAPFWLSDAPATTPPTAFVNETPAMRDAP